MKELMYLNRVHAAEIALDDTLAICDTFADPPKGHYQFAIGDTR